MLAINVSIPNLKIARLVQFWPWQFDVWTTNMNAHIIGLLNRNTGCQCCSIRCSSVSECHLGFSKVYFNSRSGSEAQYASPCQISRRSVETVCRRRKKWVGKKDKILKIYTQKNCVLGAVRGPARSLAMSLLLDHTWFLVVISSNDRAILYSYRDIARYYVKNRKISHPTLTSASISVTI